MKEVWEKWEPVKGLSEKYFINSIIDDSDGFKIVLCDENNDKKKVNITFESSVSSYTWTNETFDLDTPAFLDKEYGKYFYGKWTFFKISNSSYVGQLSKKSSGIADYYSLKHFVIIESNSMLDVIASYEPKVELVESK